MKQLLQNLRSGKTSIVEVPTPTVRLGMALVYTRASLVSAGTERMLVEFAEKSLVGKARSRPDLVRQVLDKARREGLLSTMEAAFDRLDQPMPLGYSSSGIIAALGEGMQGFKVGDRVACAGGGYAVHAEVAVVPRNLLSSLPDNVDFESAAFATLGAISLHGFRLAQPQLGESVAVIGLGLLGLLAVSIARAAGCQVLGIDLDPRRVELARMLGATAVLRDQAEEAARSLSRDQGMDVILICADTASNDPVELAGVIARDRGRVVATGAVGLNIPRKIYYEKELSFINSRSYGPGRYDTSYEEHGHDYQVGYVRWTEGRNLQAFVDMLSSGQVNVAPLISHRFPIHAAPAAYDLITGKTKEPFLGVLLTYPEQPLTGVETAVKIESDGDITPPSKMAEPVKTIKLGVLGAGNFASAVMLPAINKISGIERVAIASATGLHAQHAAQKFGFANTAEDEAHILSHPEVNTVAILTRHDLHAQQVIRALQAGKHVFCEKPLALTMEQLEEIRQQLLGNPDSPLLMVGFNRRFAPLAQRLGTFLQGRREPLAAHYRVNAGYIPRNHWVHDLEQGGGRIIGEGCHFIDFLTYLVGQPPIGVTAQALPDSGRYCEDNAILTFTFPDGSLGTGTYLANGDKSFPKERVEVFCAGKVAVLEDFRSLTLVENGKQQLIRSRLRQDKGHQAEWEVFAEALRSGGPPPIPYDQLFGVSQAAIAAVQAIRSKTYATIEDHSPSRS
jgi:predicted dehydrogenase/threonine dehydrogenase-like Zn-dependent dehydrogenase